MSRITIDDLVGKVQQRVGLTADFFLISDMINRAFQDEIVPYCEWSWRRKTEQFIFNAAYTTGTVTIERGSNIAVFSGATLTSAMVGRQLRIGGNDTPIMTIRHITGSRAELDQSWGATGVTAGTFEIYNAYQTVPTDFSSFITIADLERSCQLDHWSLTAEDLDSTDPQRSRKGTMPEFVVLRDYSSDRTGIVHDPIAIAGTADIITSGDYTGLEDAVFTVELTASNAFRWRKDSGNYTSGVAVDAEGSPQELQDGVFVEFPTTETFVDGDIFIIRCSAETHAGLPRYEFWPHLQADESVPFLYLAEAPDLSVSGTVIPRYVNTGALIEKALAAVARWNHPDNKYYDLRLANLHDARALAFMVQMQREDQGRETTDVRYHSWSGLPTAGTDYSVNRDLGYD
jgi:hypothetical protein